MDISQIERKAHDEGNLIFKFNNKEMICCFIAIHKKLKAKILFCKFRIKLILFYEYSWRKSKEVWESTNTNYCINWIKEKGGKTEKDEGQNELRLESSNNISLNIKIMWKILK